MTPRIARSLAFVLFAVVAVCVARSTMSAAVRPPKLQFQMTTLPNGLTVILEEDHSTPIIHLEVWYHVGSKNEKEGKTGFAHLFEHLMFSGSEHFNTTT
jgi:zinc protease